MFFHVDESGNTGNNLFDKDQPTLSYGLLSSTMNVDILCSKQYLKIQKIIGSERIHANELGISGLTKIALPLTEIQKKMNFDFDYYFIEKQTHALVMFFDAVFDAGLNDAVKWDVYWTPLRYMVIGKLSTIFDEALLRTSWDLCSAKRIENRKDEIIQLLTEVKLRIEMSKLDARSKELITDALKFGILNPLALDFGFPDQKMISPNAVGFQFVSAAIARRTRKKGKKHISSIVIDRQTQFNKTQMQTHLHQLRASEGLKNSSQRDRDMFLNHPLHTTINKDDISLKGLTDKELTVSNSGDSFGLQIVDVYLWLANKVISKSSISPELAYLWSTFSHRSNIDGISMKGMHSRFQKFMAGLPNYEDLTDAQLKMSDNLKDAHREKVKHLLD